MIIERKSPMEGGIRLGHVYEICKGYGKIFEHGEDVCPHHKL